MWYIQQTVQVCKLPMNLPCKYSTCGGGEQALAQLEAKTEAQAEMDFLLSKLKTPLDDMICNKII